MQIHTHIVTGAQTQKLAPEWEAAAKQLQGGDTPIALAKVDCTTDGNKALAERFGIKGFPTIKVRLSQRDPFNDAAMLPWLSCLAFHACSWNTPALRASPPSRSVTMTYRSALNGALLPVFSS